MLRILLLLISLIKILTYKKISFELVKGIEKGNYFGRYFPYKIQFYSDGNIVMSIPRVYWGEENPDIDIKANPPLFNLTNGKTIPNKLSIDEKIYSVMGFIIDKDDSLYILDQGIINSDSNTTKEYSSKLIKYNEKNKGKRYDFTNINLTHSLLTDIAVDHEGNYAYITDSGYQNVESNTSGIIVVNLKNNKTYKILNNDESFKHKENRQQNSTYDHGEIIYNYFHEAIGVNSIQISCNDDTIYYTSLKKKKIFSVSTNEIKKAIKKYEITKNIDDLNNIKVNSLNIDFTCENSVISSKNNIFSLNFESKYIEASFNINEDLSVYDKDIVEIMFNDTNITRPISISVFDGNLYLLDLHETTNNCKALIYKAELKTDELDNNFGCTVYYFKFNGAIIFIFAWFFIILVVVIIIIIANSGNTLEKANLRREKEKEAEINELNKELNE